MMETMNYQLPESRTIKLDIWRRKFQKFVLSKGQDPRSKESQEYFSTFEEDLKCVWRHNEKLRNLSHRLHLKDEEGQPLQIRIEVDEAQFQIRSFLGPEVVHDFTGRRSGILSPICRILESEADLADATALAVRSNLAAAATTNLAGELRQEITEYYAGRYTHFTTLLQDYCEAKLRASVDNTEFVLIDSAAVKRYTFQCNARSYYCEFGPKFWRLIRRATLN